MHSQIKEVNYTGLSITHYKSDNIYPLLPLLSQEFPNWTIDKIKNYVKLVITKNHDVAGMLVAQNEAAYNVGLLVYTFQSISPELIGNTKIQKKTKSMIFLTCELNVEGRIVATASGVWKILKLPRG